MGRQNRSRRQRGRDSCTPARDAPLIAVTAHLDTVLAPRTPDDIKVSGDGKLHGPGVSDNGAGLSALLAIAAAWQAAKPLDDGRSRPS